MEYVVNLMDATADPTEWARKREAQGGTCFRRPITSSPPIVRFPHVWVTATALAAATTEARITTSFVSDGPTAWHGTIEAWTELGADTLSVRP